MQGQVTTWKAGACIHVKKIPVHNGSCCALMSLLENYRCIQVVYS